MYAIVNIAGQQYKVEKDQKLFVHRLGGKEGESMHFDEVLLIDNDKNILIGEPILKGARIVGKVISHPKGDKVKVFKKKKRKGYKVQKGHRQYMTEIQIQDIIEKGVEKKPAEKAAGAPKKEAPAGKSAASRKTTATPKKEPARKTTASTGKPAAKKSTESGTSTKPAAKKPGTGKPAAKKE
jgi:large subunit ribosomal protein L21